MLIGGALVGTVLTLAVTSSRLRSRNTPHAPDSVPAVAAPPARSYGDLARNPWTVHQQFEGTLANLPVAGARTEPGDREAWILRRAQRRAYDGAPPTVPHAITERSSAACLLCHANGMAFPGGDRASTICHDEHSSCTQCHVPDETAIPGVDPAGREHAVLAKSRFSGRTAATGTSATPGAPPLIPHSTWMRERCDACHGSAGPNPLRTEHPKRTHCRQCHASSAQLDGHPGGG